jgi:hypothetical protein
MDKKLGAPTVQRVDPRQITMAREGLRHRCRPTA